jgi:LytS/YehU family sensor histidine kinase
MGRASLFNSHPHEKWFHLVLLIIGVILCPILIGWFNYLQKKKQSWFTIALVQFIIAITLSAGFQWATYVPEGTYKMRKGPEEFQAMSEVKKVSFVLFSGSTYSIFTSFMMLSALGLLIVNNEQIKQRKLQESALRENLMRMHIKALQSELQPHFIFNTLHSASSLMETDIEKAQQLIERLAFLLRSYLEIINRQFYGLDEELNFLKEYIEVQQLRHNGTIRMDVQVDTACLSFSIPVILLQPIIENSIKHGWTDRSIELRISVEIKRSSRHLIIQVRDNGSGKSNATRSGVGLRNLAERLHVLYNDDYSFHYQIDNGYFTEFRLPIRE